MNFKRILLVILVSLVTFYVLLDKNTYANIYYTNEGISEPEVDLEKFDDSPTIAIEPSENAEVGPIPSQDNIIPMDTLYKDVEEEKILGNDNRKLVKNFTSGPYRKVVKLNMKYPNGKSYSGSGIMIGEDTVLTAAHNIYTKEIGGWASYVTVFAGAKNDDFLIGKAHSKKLFALKEWIDSTSYEHDLAVIKLDTKLGRKTGTLSITTNMIINERLETSGFPGDKTGSLQYNSEGNLKKMTNNNVFYDMDTWNGQSGSGVWNKKIKSSRYTHMVITI